MEFNKKTWQDRISEYPTRRRLTFESDSSQEIVLFSREEGSISQQGDAFSAENMNDLENRIEEAIQNGNADITASTENINARIDTTNTNLANLSNSLGGYTLRYMTKAQYNALTTKDTNTLYFIPE